MKTTSKPTKKELQEKISNLLNAFVNSISTVKTKKIKKKINRVSKSIAKSVKKSLKKNSENLDLKKPTALRKRASRKSNLKSRVKPSPENILALFKKKQNKLLKESLPKEINEKILETPNHRKSVK